MDDMPIRRTTGTQPLTPPPNLPPANPAPGAVAPPAGAPNSPSQPLDSNAVNAGRQTGTSKLSLPGTGTLKAANDKVNSITGTATGVNDVMDGMTKMANGDLIGGGVEAGKGALSVIDGTGTTAKTVSQAANLVGAGNNRAMQTVDKVAGALTSDKTTARLGAAGGVLQGVSAGAEAVKGVNEIRDGKYLQGGLDLAEGAVGMTQSVGTVAKALAPASSVATALGGKVIPALGVASGVLQTAQALSKDPPDYTHAATGAMTAVGSALMPFPPAGTIAGGVLVAGAAIIDNWDTISSVADKVGGGVADAAHAVADTAASTAKAAGDAVISGAKSAAKSVANFFGF
ncbi:MAG: hypothetical protein JWM80_4504 [Cyanobacteria bacterium RYN_339]|nr:hypothetical protein [Cyanobacteria bacterium RYN_339]